jgi:hypothetical protein
MALIIASASQITIYNIYYYIGCVAGSDDVGDGAAPTNGDVDVDVVAAVPAAAAAAAAVGVFAAAAAVE